MNNTAAQQRPRYRSWRIAGWSAIALLLSIPAVFRFPWTLSDFVIMGVLLGSVGFGIDFLVRQSGSLPVRLGLVVAVLTGFLTIWVNLAVGMIGDASPYNLLFLLPLMVGLVGGIIVRLEPHRMSALCLVATVLQVGIGLGGYGMDPRGAIFSAGFGMFWLLAATLFRMDVKAAAT